jgi:hypothetical protein
MSSPGLKPTVELRNSGPQPELVDTATTRALVLSPLEARLLSLWDGICSASHLTDVARAHGLVIEGRQAAVFLERLSRAGFLTKAQAALEALTHAGELERLATEEAALAQEAASLGEALTAPPFTAHAAGRLTWLKQPGDEVQAGDAVLQVDPGLWEVRLDMHLTLPPGLPVNATVTVGGASLEVRRLKVTDTAVAGVVQSPTPLAATGTLEVSAGERQAWEVLVGSQ